MLVVDVAESPVERPQKHSDAPRAGRRSATPSKPTSSSRTRPARASVSPSGRGGSTTAHYAHGARARSRPRSRVEQPKAIKGSRSCMAIAKLRTSSPGGSIDSAGAATSGTRKSTRGLRARQRDMESVSNPGRAVEKQTEAIWLTIALVGESLQLRLETPRMTFARGLIVICDHIDARNLSSRVRGIQ